jgi:hypothetical protein
MGKLHGPSIKKYRVALQDLPKKVGEAMVVYRTLRSDAIKLIEKKLRSYTRHFDTRKYRAVWQK